jgi:hypothetical protein
MPVSPSIFDVDIIQFHPKRPEWLLYIGQSGCDDRNKNRREETECQAKVSDSHVDNVHMSNYLTIQAFVSQNNGIDWKHIESYVRNCNWAASKKFTAYAEGIILCEVYQRKSGSQRTFVDNPLQLVVGENFFEEKRVVFESITGFSLVDEFLVVATVRKY